mgnify:CR=1 FL=1
MKGAAKRPPQAVEKVLWTFPTAFTMPLLSRGKAPKSPRFARRTPADAGFSGHLIPHEAGCRPLALPRRRPEEISNPQVF